jgi:glycosyltransferase involved in cell wall biosynthesis
MIVGDGGVGTLARLLKSVLVRADGPLVDEVILAWNGKDDRALQTALAEVATVPVQLIPAGVGERLECAIGPEMPVTVLRQAWQGRFDTARNESFALATGEWVIWLDSDDVVASAATPEGLKAIEACERDAGIIAALPEPGKKPEPTLTLKQWLEKLPFDVNAVLAPYDYTTNDSSYVVVRQMMKRIIRRSTRYVWRNAIHEVLYPTTSVGERSVSNAGFLVQHFPAEAVLARAARNREIVLKLQTPGMAVDARHAFDLANAQITLGDKKAADESLKRAIERTTTHLDHYNYRLARAGLNLEMGNLEVGLNECLAAMTVLPSRADAYYVAAEAFFRGGRPEACIDHFERGAAKAASLSTFDQPLAKWVSPRCQAALSYLAMGQPEKGLVLAKEALARYPEDPLALDAFNQLSVAAGRLKTMTAVLDTVEYLLANGGSFMAGTMIQALGDCVPLRGIEALPRFQALKAKDAAFGHVALRFPTLRTDTFRGGSGEAVDMLSLVDFIHTGDAKLDAAQPDGNGFRVAWRVTKKPSIAFVCPHAAELWKPSDVDSKGLGGSEGSVVYLARELARRGYPVTIHTPGSPSMPALIEGVLEHAVDQFNAAEPRADIIVACRAPWMLRNPEMKVPTLFWHQDNGYDNDWSWNEHVEARSKGSLHVSEWAKQGLLRDLGHHPANPHWVVGNGITKDLALCQRTGLPTRNPKKLVYASDLSRGLGPLIAMWPRILAAEPEAELHIFGSYAVTAAMAQATPGLGIIEEVEKFAAQVQATPRVTVHGWVPHKVLAEEMLSAGVYAYPGGPMPEGFGVSLVQASAAGCAMVYPDAGALPEVLPSKYWMLPREDGLQGSDVFVQAILMAMESDFNRIEQSQLTWEKHNWSAVADRVEVALKGVA